MPIEASLLDGKPCKIFKCPKCGAYPFKPFMRGMVQLTGFRLWVRVLMSFFFGGRVEYCSLICWNCKEIVGRENPADVLEWKFPL